MRFPAPGNIVRFFNPRHFNPRALVAVVLASTLHKVFLSRKPQRRIFSTAKQEASLALLCERLPSALQSAGCGSKATLWGVTLSSGSAEDPQAAALLRQFLQVQGLRHTTPLTHPSLHASPHYTPPPRYTSSLATDQARKYHVEKTAKMIEGTLRWRREYGVERLRAEDFADLPADEIAPQADADGHTVVTLRLGAVPKSAFVNRARYLQWRLCMQEAGLRSLALGREDAARPGYVYVLDCEGLKAFHVSKAARRCATDLTKVMMQCYPDCAPPPLPPPPAPPRPFCPARHRLTRPVCRRRPEGDAHRQHTKICGGDMGRLQADPACFVQQRRKGAHATKVAREALRYFEVCGGGRGGGGRGGGGRGGGGRGSGGRAGACFKCGQPGHWEETALPQILPHDGGCFLQVVDASKQ